MRIFVKVLIALCAPVTLIAQGAFWQNAALTWPWWATAIALAAHAVVLLGFASLVDSRQQTQRQ
jgi:hypothetical protein